ncbi:cadherin-86C-like [Macrosteles quadrilineatus]|uniref:cadherin-86C-like n=1 Tax=Macrosteles quadrilineatus TaxID=74068 RepID=UPI0023E24E2C|nr:cadherin-86C-like [Macrosteles quadrilineatus]
MVLLTMATVAALLVVTEANYPVFDASNNMRHLLLPSDTRIGTVIYRLRATDPDRDYPLSFAATDYGSYVIRIESLQCHINASSCSANVFLERSVAPGQLYKFRLTVRDTTGDTTTVAVTIEVTTGQTDINTVFPHIPGVIMVPEDTRVGTELEYVIVRRNQRIPRPATIELWPAPEFRLVQSSKKETSTGLIKLAQSLDYELQTMYRLSIYALDMFVVPGEDSRNIAGFQVVVVVSDVQDTPPVWDHIDPLTVLPANLTQGSLVMRVTARDGDTGSPRRLKYGLISEGNPFTVFFSIERDNGEIRLVRPLRELASISRPHQPVLLRVVAEEVVTSVDEPQAMASEATVALLVAQLDNSAPYFKSTHYNTMLEENSVQGTLLIFSESTSVKDNEVGKIGVFALSLENNNGTFEVSPSVAEGQAQFTIRVRDNSLLDYETNRVLSFRIVAQEVAPSNKAVFSSVNVTVYVLDVNDNAPVFAQPQYIVSMAENVTGGHKVTTVMATDVDTSMGGVVRYTQLLGHLNTSLTLHPHSGDITVTDSTHGFDREQASEYRFIVEARDMDGLGHRATVPLIITVIDVNDEAPRFVRDPMDFVLDKYGLGFVERAFIKALDADAEPPNNIVRYEIVSGNYGDRFSVHGETGELRVVKPVNRPVRQTISAITTLTVRAYDMGIPTKWSIAQVRVYPHTSGVRVLVFLVPGRPDKSSAEQLLEKATGAPVTVQQVTPLPHYRGPMPVQDLSQGSGHSDKSVVVATVMYGDNSVAATEVEKLHQSSNKTQLVAAVGAYQTENRLLFWILLLILLLIALTLLTLLCCCLCPCCPLYATTRKRSRIHTAEKVQFVVKEEDPGHESKSVQAEWNGTERREAWSGNTYTHHSWQFNRRNTQPQPQPQRVLLVAEGGGGAQQPPVSVIYTRDLAQRHDHVMLEDVDGTEYRVLDPSQMTLPVRVEEDLDAESIRRHEFERGSDLGRVQRRDNIADSELRTRDQMFIRDGNAEILRLVTRGRVEEEEPRLNQPDTRPYTIVEGMEGAAKQEEEGKEIIMQRFIEDQKKSTEDNEKKINEEEELDGIDIKGSEKAKRNTENGHFLQSLLDRNQQNFSSSEINRLTVLQRDLLLTRFLVEEQRRTLSQLPVHDDTQSLPGMVTSLTTMATQTDVNRGTQTEVLYTMRPPRRKAKSDLDDSEESDTETSMDYHSKIIRKHKKNRRRLIRDLDIPERGRSLSRCDIKTPIMEETESAVENIAENTQFQYAKGAAGQGGFTATKSSMLRLQSTRKKIKEGVRLEESNTSLSKHLFSSESANGVLANARIKSVSEQNLFSLNTGKDSLQKSGTKSLQSTPTAKRKDEKIVQQKLKRVRHEMSFLDDDESDEEVYGRSKSSLNTRNACTSPIQTYVKRTSSSTERLSSRSDKREDSSGKSQSRSVEGRKTPSRYMEWYKTKKEEWERKKTEEKEKERQRAVKPVKPNSQRLSRRDTQTPKVNIFQEGTSRRSPAFRSLSAYRTKKEILAKQNAINTLVERTKKREKSSDEKKFSPSPERKLSFKDIKEEQKPKVFEDDRDSGIAMLAPGSQNMKRKNQNLMEKKSVFTIVYDDMQTKQLRLDSASPP